MSYTDHIRRLLSYTRKAVDDYEMIKENDKMSNQEIILYIRQCSWEISVDSEQQRSD